MRGEGEEGGGKGREVDEALTASIFQCMYQSSK